MSGQFTVDAEHRATGTGTSVNNLDPTDPFVETGFASASDEYLMLRAQQKPA